MADEDNITVRASDETKALLHRLKDEGYIDEMLDGYRLAVALAHVQGRLAPEGLNNKMNTFVNVGSLDKDGSLRNLIAELYPDQAAKPYAIVERLAEAGVTELARLYENNQLRFSDLYRSLAEQSNTS